MNHMLLAIILCCCTLLACRPEPESRMIAEDLDRGLAVLKRPDGSVFLSWRLLDADPADVVFHVYRQQGSGVTERLSEQPLHATFFEVANPPGESGYFISALRRNREISRSRMQKPHVFEGDIPYLSYATKTDALPYKLAFADLDGDGALDFVIKHAKMKAMFRTPANLAIWKPSPSTFTLEAYLNDGTWLWSYEMGPSIEMSAGHSPFIVYDIDGDGKAEVYAKAGDGDPRNEEGRVEEGPEYLVKIDGMTGEVVGKVSWPDRKGFANPDHDYAFYVRNRLGIAYLDGIHPSVLIWRGIYTLIKLRTYDGGLNEIWRWRSDQETPVYNGQASHTVCVSDVDGDGFDEIVLGSAVVDHDGRGLWTADIGHPDAVHVGDIDPANPGLEIFLGIEGAAWPKVRRPIARDGMCLLDAKTGRILWTLEDSTWHIHGSGMAADIIAGIPGQECYAGEQDYPLRRLFAADGTVINEEDLGTLDPITLYWDGDPQKELILRNEIQQYKGRKYGKPEMEHFTFVADLVGDWREEIITVFPGEVRIYISDIPTDERRVCLLQNRQYRLDVSTSSTGGWRPPQVNPFQ